MNAENSTQCSSAASSKEDSIRGLPKIAVRYSSPLYANRKAQPDVSLRHTETPLPPQHVTYTQGVPIFGIMITKDCREKRKWLYSVRNSHTMDCEASAECLTRDTKKVVYHETWAISRKI